MNVIFQIWNLGKPFFKLTPTSKKNETTIELKEMVDKWIQSNCIISEIKEN